MKKILLAVDGSDSCNKATLKASELAKMSGAEVTILNVIEDHINIQISNKNEVENIVKHHAQLKEESSSIVKGCANHFKDVPQKINTIQKEGIPSEVICKTAEEEEFDLVVVADMGRTAFKKFMLGSTTEKVVRHCKTSVLIVK